MLWMIRKRFSYRLQLASIGKSLSVHHYVNGIKAYANGRDGGVKIEWDESEEVIEDVQKEERN